MKKRSKDKRQKESVNLEENKIFFVKVGTGRDHMTVKVKAPNSREALKKIRAQHPKDKVSLDQNQKQGRSAGAMESVELDEALQSVTKIKFDYKDTMPKDPKPSDVGGLKQDWNRERMSVRDAVKSLGGLVTDSEAPSRTNKFVGTLSIGTRGDASKLSNSAIQKAVKRKGTEIQNNQFMGESSLPPHLQKIIGKNGQIDKKKVDQHVHGKKTKVTDVTPKGYGPKEDVDEATMADRTVLRAVRIAKDMAGNHTGASKRIEKMKKGLSDHPKVKDALRLANESVATADKKPQNFRDPETGKLKVRMVPVDRDVIRSDDAARVVRKKRFKHLRSK